MSTVPGKAPALKQPPQVETAQDLLLEHLGRLLTIEETLAKRLLPEIGRRVQDEELAGVLDEHLEQTREHVERVRGAFAHLDERPFGRPALGLDGLGVELEATLPKVSPGMRDGVLCEAAMGTERYEINAYEAAIRLAAELGATGIEDLLRANLDDEVDALERLAVHADRLAHLAVAERAIR